MSSDGQEEDGTRTQSQCRSRILLTVGNTIIVKQVSRAEAQVFLLSWTFRLEGLLLLDYLGFSCCYSTKHQHTFRIILLSYYEVFCTILFLFVGRLHGSVCRFQWQQAINYRSVALTISQSYYDLVGKWMCVRQLITFLGFCLAMTCFCNSCFDHCFRFSFLSWHPALPSPLGDLSSKSEIFWFGESLENWYWQCLTHSNCRH